MSTVKLSYIDCFKYALAWKQRNKIATAQAWACFALEVLNNEIECRRCRRPKHLGRLLSQYRNSVFHGNLLNEHDFNKFIQGIKKLLLEIDGVKVTEGLSPEDAADLMLKVGDMYYPKRSEVGHFNGFEQRDFESDSILQKRVWSLKYDLDDAFKQSDDLVDLQTGLISEIVVSSGWVWLPVGLCPMEGNARIRKPVISILILRSGVRIYFDLPTEVTDERLKYYRWLQERKLDDILRLFVKKYPDACFFNTSHYSSIVGEPQRIVDWLDQTASYEIDCVLSPEITSIEKKIRLSKESGSRPAFRSNKMLFGLFYNVDHLCRQKKDFINTALTNIKDLRPVLDILCRVSGLNE